MKIEERLNVRSAKVITDITSGDLFVDTRQFESVQITLHHVASKSGLTLWLSPGEAADLASLLLQGNCRARRIEREAGGRKT